MKKTLFIVSLVITIFNTTSAYMNDNFSATLGWGAAICWLIILLVQLEEIKQLKNKL